MENKGENQNHKNANKGRKIIFNDLIALSI